MSCRNHSCGGRNVVVQPGAFREERRNAWFLFCFVLSGKRLRSSVSVRTGDKTQRFGTLAGKGVGIILADERTANPDSANTQNIVIFETMLEGSVYLFCRLWLEFMKG